MNNNYTSFKIFERHFMNTKLQFLLLSSVYRSKFKINFFVHSTPHEFDLASCAVGGGAMASGCSNCWYRMCLTSTLHDGGNSSHSFLYCHFLYRAIREMLTKKVTPKKKNDDDEETVVLNTLNGMWESAPLQILLIRKSASYN